LLAALAVNWAFLLLRSVIAMMFGLIALVWPGLTSMGLVMLFGAYALTDGALALIVALSVSGAPGFGSLLLEALIRLGVAMLAFAAPGFTALALRDIFAAWAVLSGLTAIVVAVALRRDLTGEWPLPLAGAMSVLFGVMLAGPARAVTMDWVFGPYTILFGITLLVLTIRLRQLAAEIAAASPL
jgi:uncharacterized membrane protein HdeD (DUF308 family)